VNGLQFQRSSNSVNDVVNNVTFNIGSTGSSLVTINQGTDNSSTLINNFITTYNAMMAQYKVMTANSHNSSSGTTAGSIGSQSAALTLSFVNDIKNSIGQGALLGENYISLATMGIDYQIDGTLKFNQTNYNQGISSGILSSLSQGVAVGGHVGSTVDLASILTMALGPNGSISSYIKTENQDITNTQSKISTLKDQLQILQSNYTQQYSTLNTLLYNLSQTSNQLTSSLTAVTNINSSK
jgi:flagellar hook-associated protein 2